MCVTCSWCAAHVWCSLVCVLREREKPLGKFRRKLRDAFWSFRVLLVSLDFFQKQRFYFGWQPFSWVVSERHCMPVFDSFRLRTFVSVNEVVYWRTAVTVLRQLFKLQWAAKCQRKEKLNSFRQELLAKRWRVFLKKTKDCPISVVVTTTLNGKVKAYWTATLWVQLYFCFTGVESEDISAVKQFVQSVEDSLLFVTMMVIAEGWGVVRCKIKHYRWTSLLCECQVIVSCDAFVIQRQFAFAKFKIVMKLQCSSRCLLCLWCASTGFTAISWWVSFQQVCDWWLFQMRKSEQFLTIWSSSGLPSVKLPILVHCRPFLFAVWCSWCTRRWNGARTTLNSCGEDAARFADLLASTIWSTEVRLLVLEFECREISTSGWTFNELTTSFRPIAGSATIDMQLMKKLNIYYRFRIICASFSMVSCLPFLKWTILPICRTLITNGQNNQNFWLLPGCRVSKPRLFPLVVILFLAQSFQVYAIARTLATFLHEFTYIQALTFEIPEFLVYVAIGILFRLRNFEPFETIELGINIQCSCF